MSFAELRRPHARKYAEPTAALLKAVLERIRRL
jgi:hypothetical protein